MSRLRVHPLAEEDIAAVLAYTRDRFGEGQLQRYERLIEDALTRLSERPQMGRPLRGRAGFYLHAIGRRGQRASHQVLYRVAGDDVVEVLRLLHDAMDVRRHLPEGEGER